MTINNTQFSKKRELPLVFLQLKSTRHRVIIFEAKKGSGKLKGTIMRQGTPVTRLLSEILNPGNPDTQPASHWIYWAFGLGIFAMDWFTKWLIVRNMLPLQSIPLLGEYIRLTYLRNPGSAFSLMAGSHSIWRSVLLIGMPVVTILGLTILVYRIKPLSFWLMMPLGLICGGAAGNLWDRVTVGTVVDFIEVGFNAHYFPVFNAADSALCIGISWLAVMNFRKASWPASPTPLRS
jgi:signal peptidase II